ncbi:class I SAM-dependent methyltransferase [Gammaproteobacteria bacterium]|nr:class I SAM-dependent methyltransferase [Gammaproteobacteria bacterium]
MDYIYLEENYYKNKKETFSFLIDILKNHNVDNFSLLDLGCAKGEFLYHVKNELPNYAMLSGLDYSEELIKSAKKQSFLEDVDFWVGDAQNFSLNQIFDFVVCLGTIGYFDSLDNLFQMIDKHLNKGGVALVFHLFNEADIDVHVQFRNNKHSDRFEPGWNIHSINTARAVLSGLDLSLKDIHKFHLSFDDKPKENPARSWTAYVDGEKKFINGLGQVFDLICLEVHK